MPQQLNLNLETPLDPNKKRRELEEKYKTVVGKDPLGRAFDLERLEKGIVDPQRELDRLREEDTAEDRREKENLYKGLQ